MFEYLTSVNWRYDSKTSLWQVYIPTEAPPVVSPFRPIVYFM